MTIQTVSKLQQLTGYLLQSLKPAIHANNIDAWQEGGELVLSGEDMGEGLRVALWKHRAVIQLERFPHRRINAYTLLGLVCVWMMEHDSEREQWQLKDPELDIDVISRDEAVVTLELELADHVDLLPDASGPIVFNGTRYRVAMVPINVAESVTVEERRP